MTPTSHQPTYSARRSCSPDSAKMSSRGSELLEEWPTNRKSSMSQKRAKFSDYSRMKTYQMDQEYEAAKSYTSKDRKSFQAQTLREGLRIQALISALPYRTVASIQYLMQRDRLVPEELLGIEHLVVKQKIAVKIAHERQEHSRFVLETQRRLERNPDGKCIDVALGEAAVRSSIRHVESAKLRAVLAVEF